MSNTPQIECPGCHTTGNVKRSTKTEKTGYSIGRLWLAIFTLGISLIFGLGVSRKRKVITFKCSACRYQWTA